jgi:hypothetical protein
MPAVEGAGAGMTKPEKIHIGFRDSHRNSYVNGQIVCAENMGFWPEKDSRGTSKLLYWITPKRP